jgi:ABC-type nitrate/sulfonate/bicarbonate transport system permease component
MRIPSLRSAASDLSSSAVRIVSILGALCLWEAIARSGLYNPSLFPPPSHVARAFREWKASGDLAGDLKTSLSIYFAGFGIGGTMGIMLGLLTGRMRPLALSLGPVLNFPRSIPFVAMVPLAIIWFGIGTTQKVFMVAWGSFFPVWLSTQAGIAETDVEYVWAAQSLGISGWRLYYDVYLPHALPGIISGIRTAISTGFFALAAAEMAGAFSGVAFRIFFEQESFHTDIMMAAIITIGILGTVFDWAFVLIMRMIAPWWAKQ